MQNKQFFKIQQRLHDTAQQESHIPDLIAVKAAQWLEAAKGRKALLSDKTHIMCHNEVTHTQRERESYKRRLQADRLNGLDLMCSAVRLKPKFRRTFNSELKGNHRHSFRDLVCQTHHRGRVASPFRNSRLFQNQILVFVWQSFPPA